MNGQWSPHLLAGLNQKQKQAVTAPCSGILQIIAGPGTGKTKVIVSRVAYLLLHENVPPENIIVTTFTKKAANEMMTRLRELLVGTQISTGKLLVGTFHSICYKIIQKYGSLINIEGYTIADEKDSSKVLSDVFSNMSAAEWTLLESLPEKETAPFKSGTSEKNNGYDIKKIKRKISSAKAAGLTAEEYSASPQPNKVLSVVYMHYQARLQQYHLLDFDDCLLYCHKIVSNFPVLKSIKHTLVDEFQDTNEIQLRLMYSFAKGHLDDPSSQHNVTIVGDPDQSIYAFRDAQAVNFDKMRSHYLSQSLRCNVIVLEENYRSTSGILQLSESVMRQQQGRDARSLNSNISKSVRPLKAVLSSADEEARWIALQIEYLTKLPNVVSHSDMAILVRTAFQTRAIENELVRRKIPYYMVRGRAFWDRKEVAILVDYLRCVANENDRLAYLRTINFPKRGFGPKAIADIEVVLDKHQKSGQSVFEILNMCSVSSKSPLSPSLKTKLLDYLGVIAAARALLEQSFSEDHQSAIDALFSIIYKDSGLQKEFEAETDMCLNVDEVKTQLMSFEFRENDDHFVDDNVVLEMTGMLFVRQFLESISLYDVDPGKVDEAQATAKVSISTIHGAKGLEWPVVFVPGVSEGLLPAAFAVGDGDPESVNEERRCFFVALTRAKHMLYISAYTENEGKWGRQPISKISRFLSNFEEKCSSELELNSDEALKAFCSFSNRELASQFDYKAHHDYYLKQMRVYVKREENEVSFSGFTTAGHVKQKSFRPPGIYSKTHKASAQKIKVGPKEGPSHAPLYVLSKKTEILAAKPSPLSSNKAPAYVPNRAGKKRRLGTR